MFMSVGLNTSSFPALAPKISPSAELQITPPRSIVPDHVACCIASSIDMSGPAVYGREFLPGFWILPPFTCPNCVFADISPCFGTPASPLYLIHFVGCVTSLHFQSFSSYVSPLDSVSGNASAAFTGLNKTTASNYSDSLVRGSWI